MRKPWFTVALLIGYWVLGVGGGLLSRQGGMDSDRWLFYLIASNALGIPSTIMLMGVYARMNVNVALVIAGSGAFILFQFALWAIFQTPLTLLQWVGILAVGAGTALASRPGAARAGGPAPAQPEVAAPAREEESGC